MAGLGLDRGGIPSFFFFFEMLGWGMRATQVKDKAISFSLFFKTHLSCADMKLYCSAAGYGFSMYMFYFFPFFPSNYIQGPFDKGFLAIKVNSLATVGFTGGSLPT